jgi:glycosyltransferase involved in cell wall biosynthesis
MRDRVLLSTEFVAPAEAAVFLQLADIMVLPYHSSLESSSAAVRFALGAGRPVLTTGGAIFSDVAGCTYQVPSNTPKELSRAIKTVLEDPALRQRLSAAARDYAEASSWPRVGRRYMELLKGVAREEIATPTSVLG